MIYLTFLIIPLIIGVFGWIITKKITWKEAGVQVLAQMILIGIMVAIMLSSNMSDTEVWNGNITKKKRDEVSCSHSYKCNCVTKYRTVKSCSGSGKNRRCSSHTESYQKCQTCYEHRYDVDWDIYNNLGERWSISRVDRQGLREPPRYTVAKIGDPTSSRHSYKNYIKGSPDSLFQTGYNDQMYQTKLPAYPLNVYDYHRLDRLVTIGNVSIGDRKAWNTRISEIASELGPTKQVNLVVVVTDLPQDYFQTLRRHWLGGKKNDAIPVIGVDAESNINWVEVMSLSNEEFKVRLRTELLDTKKLDIKTTLDTTRNVIAKTFKRRPMKDFEYLKSSVQPTTKQWVWGMVFSLLLGIGLSVFFYYQDPFGDEGYRRRW